jgi:outer membrane receptor protein involved in Fe transport
VKGSKGASRWIGVVVSAILFAARVGHGQTTGSIEGHLTDSFGGALPGVSVSATSPSLQGTRTTVADQTGLFRFPAVPPGEYMVRAVLTGFRAAEKAASVRLGGAARVDLVLDPLRTEEILVSGPTSAIDPTSTTTGSNYTSQVITRLPVSRNYADIVRSNPGVSTDRGDTQGRSLALTIYGATSAENQWIIDGVNTTNVFKGVQGKAINNEFVQEVEVKTGGYEAEYGGALGGVINVITKSGGNTFHGDGFVYYDSTSTAAAKEFKPGDSGIAEMRVADGSRLDYGFDLGGFLLKDRLWIFGAFNRVELRGDLSRVISSTYVSSEDRFPFDSTENLYSTKLTWNAAPSTTLVGTVFADPSSTSGAAGADPRQGLGAVYVEPVVSPDRSTWYSARKQGGADFGLRLTQLFGSRAIAAFQGGYHVDNNELQAPDGIRYEDDTCVGGTDQNPCDFPPEPNSISGGYGLIRFEDRAASTRQQYQGDVTLFEGNHEIKAGGGYAVGQSTGTPLLTGEQAVGTLNQWGTLYYIHRFFARSLEDPTPVPAGLRRGQARNFGVYLQDSWRAAPNLTINAGLRWDGENTVDYQGETILGLSTWQPRVGVVWDPWKDGKTKIFAFAGRFSYGLPTAQNLWAYGNITRLWTFNFDPVDTTQDPSVPHHGDTVVVAGGPFGQGIDSGIVATYQDELTMGVERSFGPSLTVGLKGTYRRLGNAVENRCDFDAGSEETGYNSCALITPGSSGPFASGDVPTCNGFVDDETYYACEPRGPASPPAKRVYRGIELFARKSVGGDLWIQASYVYSSLRGNYDGGVNEGLYGATLPGLNQDFDYPALWHNGYGILALDRPNRFRLDGFWVSPWRLSVGLQAFAESGAPLNRLGYFNFIYGSMVFLVPRGSEGRLPTLWGANLTLSFPIAVGPVTVTAQAYLFNIFSKQIAISRDDAWSISPAEGYPLTIYDPNQERNNAYYGSVTGRSEPRSFRAALRVSF